MGRMEVMGRRQVTIREQELMHKAQQPGVPAEALLPASLTIQQPALTRRLCCC